MCVQSSERSTKLCVVKAKPDLTDNELLALQKCTIFQPPSNLPRCSRAAVAYMANAAGVSIEGCTDPDCEHPKLHVDFARRWNTGTMVLQAIQEIEAY